MFPFFSVKEQSMEPHIKDGDFVIAFPFFRPKAGNLVVFKQDDKLMLKRVMAVHEKEKYWVEGDNKKESKDSRHFGWISKKQVLGTVKVIHR